MNLCAQFFSDLHIQREDDSRAVLFEATLRKLIGRSSHVFLVGDVFDLWISDHTYFQKRYAKIINALKDLQNSGTEIHLFEGNHDMHFGQFWQKQFGATIHPDIFRTQLGPWSVRIEHGDLMNLDDIGYLRLRWLLRTPVLKFIGRHVTGEFIASFADPWSRHSRKASSPNRPGDHQVSDRAVQRAQSIRTMMNTFAKRIADETQTDFIITGHTHVQDDLSFESKTGNCRFINLGSWFDQPAYFELTENGGAWRTVN